MKDISIIIPVWNAVDLLPRCLDSIVGQTWDRERIEVICVDDGSTDGSGALCDEYARNHPMFRVIHQRNSGGPAAPRNRGIEAATGEFLFFCDNDDFFGPEAVERMLGHARTWGSDVLLVKMGESGGREIPRRVFVEEQPRADLYASQVTSTLGPWKLYRRSLIVDHRIRFPEDCSFDDSVFSLHAMLLAGTLSVANDYEYYYWVLRPDGGNITTGDTEGSWHRMDRRVRGLERLFALVGDLADRDKAGSNILPKLIREPFAATVRRLPKCEQAEADRWADVLRELIRPYYSAEVADRLRFDVQLMCATLLQTSGTIGLRRMIETMPAIPEGTRFVDEDGRLIAEYMTDAEPPVRVSAEVGPETLRSIITLRDVLTKAEWRRGTLILEGRLTLRSGRSLRGAALELLVLDNLARDRARTIAVEAGGTSVAPSADGRILTTAIPWRATVSRDVLEAISVETGGSPTGRAPHRWDLALVVRDGDEVRDVRIGSERQPGVFAAFTSGAAATSTSVFVPDETGMKNLSVWEVTADTDLSRFRIPHGRPAANTELMSLLAGRDFAGALAAAQRIEAGLPAASVPWPRRLKAGAFRIARRARRVLGRIRRRLRRAT